MLSRNLSMKIWRAPPSILPPSKSLQNTRKPQPSFSKASLLNKKIIMKKSSTTRSLSAQTRREALTHPMSDLPGSEIRSFIIQQTTNVVSLGLVVVLLPAASCQQNPSGLLVFLSCDDDRLSNQPSSITFLV